LDNRSSFGFVRRSDAEKSGALSAPIASSWPYGPNVPIPVPGTTYPWSRMPARKAREVFRSRGARSGRGRTHRGENCACQQARSRHAEAITTNRLAAPNRVSQRLPPSPRSELPGDPDRLPGRMQPNRRPLAPASRGNQAAARDHGASAKPTVPPATAASIPNPPRPLSRPRHHRTNPAWLIRACCNRCRHCTSALLVQPPVPA